MLKVEEHGLHASMPMSIKKILVPFAGNDAELPVLEATFKLAKHFNACVEVVHVLPDPSNFTAYHAYYSTEIVAAPFDNLVQEIEYYNEISEQKARAKYKEAAIKALINYDDTILTPDYPSSSFTAIKGKADTVVMMKARLADILVVGRLTQDIQEGYGHIIVNALFNSGRPVLLIPPVNSPITLCNQRIMIAWNGSAQAARAIAFALPLLKEAKIWIFTEHDAQDQLALPAESLALYLKQHHLETEIITSSHKEFSTGVTILNEARAHNAGIVVIGAFGHSRVREMILGGVTEFMLHNADIPIFMAH